MNKKAILEALNTFEELVDDTYEPSELEDDEECQEWVDKQHEAIEFLRRVVGK